MSAESATTLRGGLAQAHWTVSDLWIAALGIGGAFSQADVQRITDGAQDATGIEHDILASALNDHFVSIAGDHPVRYWAALHDRPLS
jgi:hypothetical protein